MGEPRFVPAFVFMLSGLIVWVAHFLFIYGAAGLLCARPEWGRVSLWGIGITHLVIAASTVLALLVLGAVYLRAAAGAAPRFSLTDPRFYRGLTRWIVLLAALAVVWQGFFTLAVRPCM